ncbi:MAG: hypothetical protein AAGF89_12700 [Bacteroidota bacterium]
MNKRMRGSLEISFAPPEQLVFVRFYEMRAISFTPPYANCLWAKKTA